MGCLEGITPLPQCENKENTNEEVSNLEQALESVENDYLDLAPKSSHESMKESFHPRKQAFPQKVAFVLLIQLHTLVYHCF